MITSGVVTPGVAALGVAPVVVNVLIPAVVIAIAGPIAILVKPAPPPPPPPTIGLVGVIGLVLVAVPPPVRHSPNLEPISAHSVSVLYRASL